MGDLKTKNRTVTPKDIKECRKLLQDFGIDNKYNPIEIPEFDTIIQLENWQRTMIKKKLDRCL